MFNKDSVVTILNGLLCCINGKFKKLNDHFDKKFSTEMAGLNAKIPEDVVGMSDIVNCDVTEILSEELDGLVVDADGKLHRKSAVLFKYNMTCYISDIELSNGNYKITDYYGSDLSSSKVYVNCISNQCVLAKKINDEYVYYIPSWCGRIVNNTFIGYVDENNEQKVVQTRGTDTHIKAAKVVPAIHTASVGQTIVVKAVDENSKPTEWEAVDTNVLTSPNGTKYKITVADDGTLSATAVTA